MGYPDPYACIRIYLPVPRSISLYPDPFTCTHFSIHIRTLYPDPYTCTRIHLYLTGAIYLYPDPHTCTGSIYLYLDPYPFIRGSLYLGTSQIHIHNGPSLISDTTCNLAR